MLHEDWKTNQVLISDAHFRPYYMNQQFAPCKNFNDLIIRQENLAEDLDFLFVHLNISIPDEISPRTTFHSSTASGEFNENQMKLKKNFEKLSMDKRKKLFEMYEPDLYILDYKWNIETNSI